METPQRQVFVREGSSGRRLLGGRWYFRQDDERVGEQEGWQTQPSLAGWSPIAVPHTWNARDTTLNRSGAGWYRHEFRIRQRPTRRFLWRFRFEGASYRATVWLNGRQIGRHGGSHFPFELDARGLRRGRNTLIVKLTTLRGSTDLTHWRPAAFNGYGTGGWWNFGGLQREVYLRRIDTVDVSQVSAVPRLRCPRCTATVRVRMRLRNLGRRKKTVALVGTLRQPGGQPRRLDFGEVEVFSRSTQEFTRRFRIRRPRLWQPGRPRLYGLTVAASVEGERFGRYGLSFGVKHLGRTRDGRLLLNGRRVKLLGASIHEDDPRTGAALTPRQRSQLVRRLRDMGATVTRAHYPLHPALLEAFDRAGILYWSQAPVYQLPNSFLDQPNVRSAAIAANRETVRHNINHASIFVWSLGNELASGNAEVGAVGAGYAGFVRDGSRAVRDLDSSRLVAIDRHVRLGEPIFHPAFNRLDVLGINEYFGWYDASAPGVPETKTEDLGPYLDQLHAAYPRIPLVITEYGAEATRSGPVSQRGTFEFQTKFMRDHLGIHLSKAYVGGSIAWILKDFRVHPGWTGGNDRAYATPPWNNKGLIDQTGAPKPAFSAMQRVLRRVRQVR